MVQKVTVKVTVESAVFSWTVLDGTKLHNSSHIKSITYAHRSRVHVTESDSNGLERTGKDSVSSRHSHPFFSDSVIFGAKRQYTLGEFLIILGKAGFWFEIWCNSRNWAEAFLRVLYSDSGRGQALALYIGDSIKKNIANLFD